MKESFNTKFLDYCRAFTQLQLARKTPRKVLKKTKKLLRRVRIVSMNRKLLSTIRPTVIIQHGTVASRRGTTTIFRGITTKSGIVKEAKAIANRGITKRTIANCLGIGGIVRIKIHSREVVVGIFATVAGTTADQAGLAGIGINARLGPTTIRIGDDGARI
ncbi:unnamed protein product [Litomosoides sigmodontis]|uniref:Uncharacterized protein n=1 Tax=Litomosoides sigmodontis TaxID=42156 RepID=A0A3P6RYS2_LITSI|nr:unnamed protein product [Litomosoides sigmodontis]